MQPVQRFHGQLFRQLIPRLVLLLTQKQIQMGDSYLLPWLPEDRTQSQWKLLASVLRTDPAFICR